MKKIIMALVLLALIAGMTACAKEDISESAASATDPTTQIASTMPIESTTKTPENDAQKGSMLKSEIIAQLGSAEISGNFNYGKFTYKNIRDVETIYAYEQTDEYEKAAKENAENLVSEIGKFYADEIKLYDYLAKQIGSSENGIDSVRYEFYYINTQNQLLTIYADSDGVISYADCSFTW